MHVTRKALGTGLMVAMTATLIVACATSPTGRKQLRLISDAQLNEMGVAAFTQMKQEMPVTQSAATRRYVECVTNNILPFIPGQIDWEVQTFQSDQINAFALPGGKIGVYTGLLNVAKNQDQLAAVIGHEIAHVIAGHSGARVSNQMATSLGAAVVSAATGVGGDLIGAGANMLLVLPNSRGDESESDILGMRYMAEAGFNPAAAVQLWQNMAAAAGGKAPAEFTSTHPSHDTRIRDLNAELTRSMPIYERARSAGRQPNCRR
jgi:predicted Zn-dependent protease